jgi:hypothetical protein
MKRFQTTFSLIFTVMALMTSMTFAQADKAANFGR